MEVLMIALSNHAWALAIMALIATGSGEVSQGRGSVARPAQKTFTVVESLPTPTTLAEVVRSVDLVVFARVENVSQARADRTGPVPQVRRIQELIVLEVLKGEVPSTKRIQVRQSGGTVDVDGREVSAAYSMRIFERGDVALLFLMRVGKSGAVYDIPYDDNSVILSE